MKFSPAPISPREEENVDRLLDIRAVRRMSPSAQYDYYANSLDVFVDRVCEVQLPNDLSRMIAAYCVFAPQVGDLVDARDSFSRWYAAKVIDAQEDRLRVHFIGFSSKYDEWIRVAADRLAPSSTHTKPSAPSSPSSDPLSLPSSPALRATPDGTHSPVLPQLHCSSPSLQASSGSNPPTPTLSAHPSPSSRASSPASQATWSPSTYSRYSYHSILPPLSLSPAASSQAPQSATSSVSVRSSTCLSARPPVPSLASMHA